MWDMRHILTWLAIVVAPAATVGWINSAHRARNQQIAFEYAQRNWDLDKRSLEAVVGDARKESQKLLVALTLSKSEEDHLSVKAVEMGDELKTARDELAHLKRVAGSLTESIGKISEHNRNLARLNDKFLSQIADRRNETLQVMAERDQTADLLAQNIHDLSLLGNVMMKRQPSTKRPWQKS